MERAIKSNIAAVESLSVIEIKHQKRRWDNAMLPSMTLMLFTIS